MTVPAKIRGVATAVGLLLATTTAALTTAALTVAPASAAALTCGSGVAGDVNGDGHAEVAVGAEGAGDIGEVHVFYGRSSGLVTDRSGSARDDQVFSAKTPGIPGAADQYDEFGKVSAFGDLNGDGCADLAIGAPSAALDGTVTIVYGSKSGLTTTGAQRFTSAQVLGGTYRGYLQFGRALALADYDEDGITDLAVAGAASTGDNAVLFGSADGLGGGRPTEILSQLHSNTGVDSLAAGDFDGDGRPELAIGDSEVVTTVERGAGGFGAATPRVLTAASLDLPDANKRDRFASALATGYFNADGAADLAIGVPNNDCDEDDDDDPPVVGRCGRGSVVVVAGSSSGLVATGRQVWTQDSAGMSGTGRSEDGFGTSLATGRFDAGTRDDLAIGTPGDTVGANGGGSVSLLLGGASGLTTDGLGGSRYHQDTAGVPGTPSASDAFGTAITAARVQSSAQDNLVIGVPGQKVGKVAGAGLIHQLAKSAAGPRGTGGVTLHLNSAGVKGETTTYGNFGSALS